MSIDFYSRFEPEEESQEPSGSSIDFYSRKPTGKASRGKVEKLARGAAQYGLGAAEFALTPYELAVSPLKSKSAQQVPYRENLFKDIEDLYMQKQSGDWSEKDEEFLQSLLEQAKDTKKSEQFVKTADIGVGDLAEKASKELFDYDLAPEGFGENALRIAGNLVKPSTVSKGLKSIPDLGRQVVDKEFRHAIKEQKNWSRLVKAAEGNPEKETLLKFSQDHKLSPEATSLLFHSEGKAQYLASVGSKTKKFKGAVSELKSKLGNNYEELKELGKQGGHIDFESADRLTTKLGNLLSEMKSTHVVGPDTASAINTIEKAVESINNRGSTVKELINSRINIGESINWKNVDRGDFFKKEGRKIFAEAIKEQNPAVAERLMHTDKAWGKYLKFKDVLDKKIPTYSLKGLKLPSSVVESAIFLGAPFVIPAIGLKASAVIAGKQLFQRLATEMAVNPKFQVPLKMWQKSLMTGSTEGQKKAFLIIKNIAKKEDPDLYEKLREVEAD